MTSEEAAKLRDAMSIPAVPQKAKAIVVVKSDDGFSFKFMGMGAGEASDLLSDVRKNILEKII